MTIKNYEQKRTFLLQYGQKKAHSHELIEEYHFYRVLILL